MRSPFIALLRKELAQNRHFVLVALALSPLSTLAWALIFHLPDAIFLDQDTLLNFGPSVQIITILVVFPMGARLLVDEHDQGTEGFLDALPVSRGTTFVAKVLAGWVAIAAMHLGSLAVQVGLGALAWNASAVWLPGLLLSVTALAIANGIVALGIVLAMSFMRRIGWMLALSLYSVSSILAGSFPQLAPISPGALVDWRLHGRHLVIGDDVLAGQTLLALVAYGWAYRSHGGAGRQTAARFGSLLGRWAGWIVTGGLSLVLFIVGSLAIHEIQLAGEDEEEQDGALVATRAYRIGAERDDLDKVRDLLPLADESYAFAARSLGLPELPDRPVLVDARGMGGANHLAGTYGAEVVRISLGSSDVPSVLVHETVHALLHRADNGRLLDKGGTMTTLNEGLATWVELRHKHEDASAVLDRAAFALRRHQLVPESALSKEALATAIGPQAPYDLGCSFWTVLIEDQGPDLVHRWVANLQAQEEASTHQGRAAARTSFTGVGISFDEAVEVWVTALRARAGEVDTWMALPVPRLVWHRGTLEERSGLLARVPTSAPPDLTLIARARRDSNSSPSAYRYSEGGRRRLQIVLPPGAAELVQIQLGYRLEGGGKLWWPWRSVTPLEDPLSMDTDTRDTAVPDDEGDEAQDVPEPVSEPVEESPPATPPPGPTPPPLSWGEAGPGPAAPTLLGPIPM